MIVTDFRGLASPILIRYNPNCESTRGSVIANVIPLRIMFSIAFLPILLLGTVILLLVFHNARRARLLWQKKWPAISDDLQAIVLSSISCKSPSWLVALPCWTMQFCSHHMIALAVFYFVHACHMFCLHCIIVFVQDCCTSIQV